MNNDRVLAVERKLDALMKKKVVRVSRIEVTQNTFKPSFFRNTVCLFDRSGSVLLKQTPRSFQALVGNFQIAQLRASCKI